MTETIIAVALVVLTAASFMILRELKRNSAALAAAQARSVAKANPPPVVSSATVQSSRPGAHEDDDIDVTRVGPGPGMQLAAPGALPKLDDTDIEVDDMVSESTAITTFVEGTDTEETTGPVDLFLLSAAAQSDVGKKRKRNEDSFLLDDDRALFVVADGMGGYAGGDVASQLATATIGKFLNDEHHTIIGRPDRPRAANELVASIQAANLAIFAEAVKSPELHGMGTTVVAALFTKRKSRGYIAYAGDSRCYRFRGEELKLLTTDHTYAAKGLEGPFAGQIRRAVGIREKVKVDLIIDAPKPGDIYLLCSDGLNKMLKDEELQRLVGANREDLPTCANVLVKHANDAGGRDNVTVVVVGVREASKRKTSAAEGPRAPSN